MYPWLNYILRAAALAFVESSAAVSIHYAYSDELQGDDPVRLPIGKCIRITFEYVDPPEGQP